MFQEASHWYWVQATNWLSNILEFIILIEPFLIAMQKSNTPNPQPAIFTAVSPSVVQAIREDAICLHANVFADRLMTMEVRLAMTNFYIAVCSPHSQFSQFLYSAELQFDLKFEVIFEQQGSLHLQLGPSSKKIGFRLLKDNKHTVDLYFKSEPLLDIWLKYLSKNLNQYGFHRLYKPVKKLGKGGFATVYEVERVTDKAHFAAKAFAKSSTVNSSNPANRNVLLNEIELMRSFDNPNIMRLEAVFESENSLYMILELLPDGQAHTRINQRMAKFTEQEVKTFMRGMARALYELEKARVMHRDIKPENIMLRGATGLNPVLADFGLAADVDSEDYLFYRCGTPGYVAPEVINCHKGDRLTPACDVFSTGLILHILLVRRPLFEGRSSEEVFESNRRCKFSLNGPAYERVDPQALNLLRRMLEVDPKERISAEEMLEHPFIFQGMMEEKQVVSPATTGSFPTSNFGEAENAF